MYPLYLLLYIIYVTWQLLQLVFTLSIKLDVLYLTHYQKSSSLQWIDQFLPLGSGMYATLNERRECEHLCSRYTSPSTESFRPIVLELTEWGLWPREPEPEECVFASDTFVPILSGLASLE